MQDDIVTRLRLRPTIVRKNQFGGVDTDRAATALFNDCHLLMREAADEIERLRRNIGCARNQGTTQFCAEALDAQRELVKNADEFRETITAHRRTIECLTAERDSTIRELRKVEAERDEARRMVCSAYAFRGRDIATERGWDCYKEDER